MNGKHRNKSKVNIGKRILEEIELRKNKININIFANENNIYFSNNNNGNKIFSFEGKKKLFILREIIDLIILIIKIHSLKLKATNIIRKYKNNI